MRPRHAQLYRQRQSLPARPALQRQLRSLLICLTHSLLAGSTDCFQLCQAALVGLGNDMGMPVPVEKAEEQIFGMVLLNDWSARDIQKWEMAPLGPFNSKNWVSNSDTQLPHFLTKVSQDYSKGPSIAGHGETPAPCCAGADRESICR